MAGKEFWETPVFQQDQQRKRSVEEKVEIDRLKRQK